MHAGIDDGVGRARHRVGIVRKGPADDLYARIVNRVERELIVQVMAACNRTQTKAATRLGINRNTLHKKLKEYEIDEEEEA